MSGCCPAVAGRKRVTRLELATSSLGDAFAEVIKVSRKPEESVLLRSQLGLQRPHLRRFHSIGLSGAGSFFLGLARIGIRIHVGTVQKLGFRN